MSVTVSEAARRLADRIVQEMTLALVQETRRWRQEGQRFDEHDERAWAHNEIKTHVSDYEAECFERGRTPLTEEEMGWVTSDAHARLFGGGRLMKTWAEHDEALNMVVIGTQRARFELPGGRVEEGPSVADTDDELVREVRSMASLTGIKEVQWDISQPELELVTPEGDRLTALCWVTERPFVTLRRPTLAAVRIDDLVANGTMSPRCGSLLAAISRSGSRYLVGGSINSGKTVTLRAMASTLEPDGHLITVESSRELLLHQRPDIYPSWTTSLEARRPNNEGRGEITMSSLIVGIQRMSPSVVLVGEIRGPETAAFITAISQGYSVAGTVHAHGSLEAIATVAGYFEEFTGGDFTAGMRRVAMFVDYVVHMRIYGGRRVVDSVRWVNGYDGGSVMSTELWEPCPPGPARQSGTWLPEEVSARLEEAGFNKDLSDEPVRETTMRAVS